MEKMVLSFVSWLAKEDHMLWTVMLVGTFIVSMLCGITLSFILDLKV